ncbi:Rieske 2Fe-2S domain-containing protein [Mucilaginibacter sp. L3T2-6]|uniref:Rieske (2Fe-2S) protein n=1 Tax=Mucilaginibacter sp. L3T2-6 TaxID=3062491 RepID=UPI002675D249|nr:Rieske 2Fe-2S domain-containing protein [Mucilaginibacter sp. L3T2-6]MDO3644171.1 Rieske 2Fe-2S domain-containing protein [Mucilaginibacter sp. L3T2-6]MDV6216548.1 Rieske 2Fe-2S domain-containing protein [Mucilaginibacter sp. L3T2-6]
MNWYPVPGVPDVNKPFMTKVKVPGASICVVGYEGKIYAVSAICPHHGYDMTGGGWCENGKIICSLHGYSFDLQTGKGSYDYIKTYPVKIEGDKVFVSAGSIWNDIKQLFIK